ncbi:MAG: protease modulator HflC [Steroidobacteraceae bacterium]
MASRNFFIVILAAIVALLIYMSAFTVRQTELAIKFRFGEIVRADYAPGLHFMTPMVNNIRKFDRRILTRNYPSEQFLTSEGKILAIDFYVKWRIDDVARYYQATAGDEDSASGRLGAIVKDALKGVIAQRTIQQVVVADRAEFTGEVVKIVSDNSKELGIGLVDIRVKKIDLPSEVSESVFNRMAQNFRQQAAQLRAEGQQSYEQLRAEADRKRTEVVSTATRNAQIVRGQADAKSAEIYAKAYGRNAEFYSFYRSLEAYRSAIGQDGDIMVISPDSDFFKYLNQPKR